MVRKRCHSECTLRAGGATAAAPVPAAVSGATSLGEAICTPAELRSDSAHRSLRVSLPFRDSHFSARIGAVALLSQQSWRFRNRVDGSEGTDRTQRSPAATPCLTIP